jgi:cytidylate kinase
MVQRAQAKARWRRIWRGRWASCTSTRARCTARSRLPPAVLEEDAERLAQLAQQITIRFVADGETQRVLLDGEDVSEAIRTPEISDLASRISVHSGVRRAMVALQRALAAHAHGVVAEGRDTTTVVFPDAAVKIYLDASPQERARRRQHQLQQQGIEAPYEQVLQAILERDARDIARADSPLRIADDAIVIQNDGWSKEQTFEYALRLCRERLGVS